MSFSEIGKKAVTISTKAYVASGLGRSWRVISLDLHMHLAGGRDKIYSIGGRMGNMFPLIDRKEHGPLKDHTTAMEMKASQELGIEPNAQESGSLVMPFFC